MFPGGIVESFIISIKALEKGFFFFFVLHCFYFLLLQESSGRCEGDGEFFLGENLLNLLGANQPCLYIPK